MKISKILYALAFYCLSVYTYAGDLLIIIDDIGYSKEHRTVFQLPTSISVAIIPSSPFATINAKRAYQQQRDILIHMPMQAFNYPRIEPEYLAVFMNKEQIEDRINYAMKRVPHAIALNNHMGSKATTSTKLMQILMPILAQKKLIFVDSKTIGTSVAYKVALKNNLTAVLQRDLFLDVVINPTEIQKQWNQAIKRAQNNPLTVVIGHPHPATINVVTQGIKHLPAEVKLINFSQYLQQQSNSIKTSNKQ